MKKDILIIFCVVLVLAVLIMGTDFQSVDEYYLMHLEDITPDSETVTLSIRCDSVLTRMDKLDANLRDYIPPDGVILQPTQYVLRPGDTVFDVLYRVARSRKIQFEYQGADQNLLASVYVQGINYLYEFSCGSDSGWIYLVNGEFPSRGCADYALQDGDTVEWIYSCENTQYPQGGDGT